MIHFSTLTLFLPPLYIDCRYIGGKGARAGNRNLRVFREGNNISSSQSRYRGPQQRKKELSFFFLLPSNKGSHGTETAAVSENLHHREKARHRHVMSAKTSGSAARLFVARVAQLHPRENNRRELHPPPGVDR